MPPTTISIDGGCIRNCSFPSGESASAVALLAFILLLPERFRLIGTAILVPFIVLVSLNRVAMGSHFLSDVLIAWPLMFAVFLLLHRPFMNNRQAIDAAFSRKVGGTRPAAETRPLAEQ
ncbi:phosphatase PAP2 family protein [Agrobacterium sp. NPDC090283]|uniref:phosphatase PAP2 family protein n=1 Tax=Agrobacterium sp. NPDC090283 TaxID=3363920 RepID=UPI003839DDDB